jgi:hypothetical protein
MYYVTKKESETGKKFTELLKKKEIAIAAQKELSTKYGFETYRGAYWQAWGGFSSCLDFKETPDKKIWGKGAEYKEFYPKKNSKVAKAVWQEFQDMPCVSTDELNACIGMERKSFKTIGFAFGSDEYYGFITSKKWGVIVPKDCEEVTETKYDEVFENL